MIVWVIVGAVCALVGLLVSLACYGAASKAADEASDAAAVTAETLEVLLEFTRSYQEYTSAQSVKLAVAIAELPKRRVKVQHSSLESVQDDRGPAADGEGLSGTGVA